MQIALVRKQRLVTISELSHLPRSVLPDLRYLLCCCRPLSLHLSAESRCLTFQGLQPAYEFRFL